MNGARRMDYKVSRFNCYAKNEKNELLVYNSYTNSRVKIRHPEIYKTLQDNNIPKMKEALVQQLLQYGIIVNAEDDEKSKLKIRYEYIINDGTLALTILPTELCNFRCRYCCEPFKKPNMTKEMQNAIIEFIRKNIYRFNRLDVAWFGGEPLVAIDVIENLSRHFIEICKQHRIPYTSNITTNGYLLNHDNMKKLLKCHITSFQITVDGLEKTHNHQKPLATGGGTYQTVLDNLRNIRDNIKTKMLRIIIRTNVTKEIYADFDEYMEFYSNEFGNDERFSFFIRPVMDWGGESIKQMYCSMVDEMTIENLYDRIIKAGKLKRFDAHAGFLTKGGTMCAAGKLNYFTVEPDGKVHKCSQIFDSSYRTQVGYISLEGNMILDECECGKWLINKNTCGEENCEFSGNCMSEFCPQLRVAKS